MKLKRGIALMCVFAGVFALSSFVMAQSPVDGTWTGEAPGGRGPQAVTLTLKADGDKLTGTVGGGRGGPVTIDGGTIMGANVKFKTKQMGRSGEVVLNWTGVMKGDEIAFSRLAEGATTEPQKFTVKKQK